MDDQDEDLSTPKAPKRRSLGLRRCGTTINVKTTPGLRMQSYTDPCTSRKAKAETTEQTPTSSNSPAGVASTENTNSAQKMVQTPINTFPRIGLSRNAASTTNCRSYRLSLNRNIRKVLTKKRLQFFMANDLPGEAQANVEKKDDPIENMNDELEKENSKSNLIKKLDTAASAVDEETETLTDAEMLAEIEKLETEAKCLDADKTKLDDVKAALETWRSGFVAAAMDLQEISEPRMEMPQLLEQLGISSDMLKYFE